MEINMPYQLFINGEMVDSESGRTFDTINPTDETVIVFKYVVISSLR